MFSTEPTFRHLLTFDAFVSFPCFSSFSPSMLFYQHEQDRASNHSNDPVSREKRLLFYRGPQLVVLLLHYSRGLIAGVFSFGYRKKERGFVEMADGEVVNILIKINIQTDSDGYNVSQIFLLNLRHLLHNYYIMEYIPIQFHPRVIPSFFEIPFFKLYNQIRTIVDKINRELQSCLHLEFCYNMQIFYLSIPNVQI